MKDKRTSLPGCCWATGVSPTTCDNSVQPSIKETLNIFALLCHNHTAILLILFNTLVKYLPLQITEHESKTYLAAAGKGGSLLRRVTTACSQGASYSKNHFVFLSHTQKNNLM